ncbi:MAG TPA: histidine kinase, partial [Flavisolibacter sp.]|nr:histidine kinase [Flavisolibacter sp.]
LGDEGYANNLHSIARVYAMIGDHQTAVHYFLQSITYRQQHRQFPDWGNFTEAAASYGLLKKYDSALYCLDEGLKQANQLITDSVGRRNMTTEFRINKAMIFFNNLEKDDSAMAYFRTCLADYIAQKNDYMVADLHFKMGRLFFKRKNNAAALRLVKEAMPLAEKMALPALLEEAYLLLADLYAQNRRTDSAYHYLRLYTLIKKSEPLSPTNNNLTFYKTMLENEKNETQIQLLNKTNELKQQRLNFLIGAIIAITALGTVSVYIVMLRRLNEKQWRQLAENELQVQKLESNRAKAELQQQKTELQVQTMEAKMQELQKLQQMRMQIAADLHDDIGSTLTSISYYSEMVKMGLKDKDEAILHLLDKIGTNARNTVSAMSDIVWVTAPHNDGASTLTNRMRNFAAEMLGQRNIHYHFHADEALEQLELTMQQRKNIYLIYKEAIHNAVKYSGCTEISIAVGQTDELFSLVVQDNGRGFSADQLNGGNGLPNMKKRAE